MVSKLLDWWKKRKVYHSWKKKIEDFDRWWEKRKVYHSWKNLLHVLDLCRFSVLMLLAGWLLLFSAQGQDMLLGIAGAPVRWDWFWFLGSLAIWASSVGFFARIMLNFEFDRKMAPQDPLEVKNKTESATAGSSLQAGETEDPPEAKNKTKSAPHWSLESLRRWIPRVLLVLAFLGTGVNLLIAAHGIDHDLRGRVHTLALITFVFPVVFFLFAYFRRKYSKYRPLVPEPRKTDDLIECKCGLTPNQRILFWIFISLSVCLLIVGYFAPSSVKKYLIVLSFLILTIAFIIRFLKQLWKTDKLEPLARWTIYSLIGGAIGLGILSTLDPLSVSNFWVFHKKPIVLFMIWAATMTAFGSGIVYWSNHRGAPILTLLFIWAVGISYINDNHNLRQVEEGPPQQEEIDRINNRPKVADAAAAWLAAQKPVNDRPVPVVVVATAGGGIRAAYWTATVLGRLNRIDGFDNHLFAISGVSGGSVGAAVYRAVLADLKEGQGRSLSCAGKVDQWPSCAVREAIEPCAQQVLEGDLLVPIMAGTLYPDLVQRFWPFGDQTGLSFPDRQSALEKGFEAAYKDVMGSDRFAESLLALYKEQESWPALLLNATWVSMGRRMVASNLDLSNADAASNKLITAYDQLP